MLPPVDPNHWYRQSQKAPRQGDISLVEYHQLRDRSGERPGPGAGEIANEDLPYLGPYVDYPIEVPLPGTDRRVNRVLRVWVGYAMVLHQNCELHYADAQDSRLIVAPIATRGGWPTGPWAEIEKNQLPGFLYLPGIPDERAAEFGAPSGIPEGAVAFASATLISRSVFAANRLVSLAQERLSDLQGAIVRFFGVRGWASTEELANLEGKRIVSAQETIETVPGPSRLAKIVLAGDEADDEITVTWGLRRARPRSNV
jgi:hypothetical protein